jgi:starch synthase
MKVLFVTSEVAGLYKRGGLADVSYSLPVALSKSGVKVAIAVPFYEKIKLHDVHCVGQLAIDFDRRRELVFIFETILPGTTVPVYLFRHPMLNNYDDEHIVARFAFFSKAVAQLYLYAHQTLGGPYDIIHCNDWHTALIPLLVGENRKVGFRERETLESTNVKTVLTIHNLMYKGETGLSLALKLGFPKSIFHDFATPLGRAIRLLTEGMECADIVTTVSPTYADEIMKGKHGGLVTDIFKRRGDRMVGILNGIDQALWDPMHDQYLPENYGKKNVASKKQHIKEHLQTTFRLPKHRVPLFGFVGRLESRQKGLDLIASAIRALPKESYQLVLLGTGEKKMVNLFTELSEAHENVGFVHTFDERLARRIYAGSDIMLIPSKFEPCGLTQMIAMRYGTLPLVRKTGGLADSVDDKKTGFVFGPYTKSALIKKMQTAMALYRDDPDEFGKMIGRVMKADFSWQHQVKSYKDLYRELLDTA